jgi:hypothetical protein
MKIAFLKIEAQIKLSHTFPKLAALTGLKPLFWQKSK